MDELLSALLGWAVALSGYPAPAGPPHVARVPHEFFVRKSYTRSRTKDDNGSGLKAGKSFFVPKALRGGRDRWSRPLPVSRRQ
jgi:hypothetical protein